MPSLFSFSADHFGKVQLPFVLRRPTKNKRTGNRAKNMYRALIECVEVEMPFVFKMETYYGNKVLNLSQTDRCKSSNFPGVNQRSINY